MLNNELDMEVIEYISYIFLNKCIILLRRNLNGGILEVKKNFVCILY